MQKVLVVDDDPHIRDVVCFALRRAGYQPLPADNGLAALELAAREGPALVVLDILMPELDGAEVCKRLRKSSDVPIIFLTSKDEEMDRILGLELGADDYVVKPFSPRELVARVKTVLRRKGPPVTAEQRLVRGRLVVDLEAIAASWDGAAVTLTATEFALLKAIAAQPRRVFTRENLMTASYVGARFVSDRTIDSHVRHIRAKFQSVGGDPIETVHGSATDSQRPEGPRRRLPGVRTLLLATYLAVLLLPVGGIGFLRLYESALIRQTEAELLAQAAVLSAAYRAAWLERASPEALAALPLAKSDWGVAPAPASSERWRALLPQLDLAESPILPRAPDPVPAARSADPIALVVAETLAPVLANVREMTLAGIRIVDARTASWSPRRPMPTLASTW